MPPRRFLPGRGRDELLRKINGLRDMIESEKFTQLINQLDTSLEAQQTAIEDIAGLLKSNGIAVPEGVTFHINPQSGAARRSQVEVTMDIYFQHPAGTATA